MKKRIGIKNDKASRKMQKAIQTAVNQAFTDGFASVLHDISYRIDSLMNIGLHQSGLPSRITSDMLNLATPILDGFAFASNSPSAGSVAWTDCNVMYKGTKYVITNGNSAMKYIYWTMATTPNTFKFSDTKPVLTVDDILVAVNTAGIYQMVIGEGRMVDGAILVDGTVNTAELAAGAVSTAKIANLAISSGLLADDAVTNAKIASNAVTTTELADNAVTNAKITDNAVTATELAANAVTGVKILDGAVADTKIAANAVTATKILDGAVAEAKLAAGAVSSTKLADGAVATTKLANSSVTTIKIGAGAVATDKLNIASHLIF